MLRGWSSRPVSESRGTIVGLLALLVALMPLAGIRAADEPILTLTPNQGPCGSPIIVRGANFPSGETAEIVLPRDPKKPPSNGVVQPTVTVAADGTFSVEVIPCTDETPGYDQNGTQYLISAIVQGSDQVGPPQAYAAAVFTVGPVAQAPIPTLTLTPDHGACNSTVVLRGENFPPGETILFYAFPVRSDHGVQFAQTAARADGSFAIPIEMRLATNCTSYLPGQVGTQYRITATLDQRTVPNRHAFASAIYSVSKERLTTRCFAETGHCVSGRFLEHWETRGLAVNGYPLSDEFQQVLEDGNEYTVQYFERVRMELHPENPAPYAVLLGQFGRHFHPADPSVQSQDGASYFAETGHNVAGDFLNYWQVNGGLAQFGYPLTEEVQEMLEDGQTYTVQYFERARFERHLENAPPYDILLGQFGRRILAETMSRTLTLDPTSGPCPIANQQQVTVHGWGFTPGVTGRFILKRDHDGAITAFDSQAGGLPAEADGTFIRVIPLGGCGPAEPAGSTFTITMFEYTPNCTPAIGPGASASFTVTPP